MALVRSQALFLLLVSQHSNEKFGPKYSPGPCRFDVLGWVATPVFFFEVIFNSGVSLDMELTYVTQRSYVSSYPQVMDKGRWFGAQLSLRSGLAWPAYVSGEKLGNLFLSWKNMYHVARIRGISRQRF